jgi:hypothetical protein
MSKEYLVMSSWVCIMVLVAGKQGLKAAHCRAAISW